MRDESLMTCTISQATAGQRAAWDSYVTGSPAGTFCHLSGWGNVVERTWGYERLDLVAEEAGRIVGVLPLFHVDSWLFGSRLISTPNAVYGGVIADTEAVARALDAAATALGARRGAAYVELREPHGAPTTNGTPVYARFGCELMADEEALMKRFPSDLRRMIRLGPKNDLVATVGGVELLDEFYDVYATSLRNLGTPVFPKRLFEDFLREFAATSDILAVRQHGRLAAAVLSFYFRGVVMPYYAGAYAEFLRTGVNNFMYWELMRHARTRGCDRFDFGRSKVGTGAYAFKRGWRMEEESLEYRHLPITRANPPDLTPLNPRFQRAIGAWKRLPLGVTKFVGPLVVRHLP